MENDLNERQPKWKMTSKEFDINGRRPQWKTISMENNLYGEWPQWKLTLRKPYRKHMTLTCLASQFCTELGPAQPQLVFSFIIIPVLQIGYKESPKFWRAFEHTSPWVHSERSTARRGLRRRLGLQLIKPWKREYLMPKNSYGCVYLSSIFGIRERNIIFFFNVLCGKVVKALWTFRGFTLFKLIFRNLMTKPTCPTGGNI